MNNLFLRIDFFMQPESDVTVHHRGGEVEARGLVEEIERTTGGAAR